MDASNLSNHKSLIIPDDVIIQSILPKLPPRSLVRFQCVSKLWKLVISDPNFNISLKHRVHALFIGSKISKLLKNDNLSYPLRLEKPQAPLPPNIDRILGSCNGLVLFCNECDIFLWNPTTSYCQKVHELDCLNDPVYSLLSGFCYDDSIEDYVVLATFTQFSPGWYLPVISSTLKSKKWRLVSFPFDVDSVVTGPIVNNKLHWLASPKGCYEMFGHPNTIIYFDAPSNAFNKLPSPYPIDEGGDDMIGLGVLDDCLCLMRLDKEGDVEVLVMKDYGVKESWGSMFRLPHNDKNSYRRMGMVLCSWKGDAIVFFTISRDIHVYYPRTKTMKKIKVPGVSRYSDWSFQVISYVEAFVSPSGYYWNEESDKKIASTRALDFYSLDPGWDANFSEEED